MTRLLALLCTDEQTSLVALWTRAIVILRGQLHAAKGRFECDSVDVEQVRNYYAGLSYASEHHSLARYGQRRRLETNFAFDTETKSSQQHAEYAAARLASAAFCESTACIQTYTFPIFHPTASAAFVYRLQ